MNKVELLAPAKDKQTALAAINCGADAIYIGAFNFGARKNAANQLEDIKEIVDYAHKFYVKVHVTINTILTDKELIEAKSLIEKLYQIGVDAIIVQDMGIFELCIKNELPPILIHASTQCDIRTLEKAKFFDKLGVSRVILARELSIDKIAEICKSLNAEVETFIHGALCVSYSGQCYLSQYIGSRSANRGECAQPCRKKYSLINDKGKIIAKNLHLLSLRDFNASKHLEKLAQIGVKSFKIEGRLKSENYVKNVVAYYHQIISSFAQHTSSGKIFLDFTPDVNKSFNRGFTDYFLENRKKCFNFESPKSLGEKLGVVDKVYEKSFTIKNLKQKINPQDGLIFNNKGCLVNKFENNRIFPNKMDGISAGLTIYRNFDAQFEKQLTNTCTRRRIGVKFEYENGVLQAVDEDFNTVYVPVLSDQTPKNQARMLDNFKNQLNKTGESDFYVTDIVIKSELPFFALSNINELRRSILNKLMQERLKNYPREFQKPLNYSDFPYLQDDYHANVYNAAAKYFYEKCNCKIEEPAFETGKSDIKELMRTKHCLKFALDMCKSQEKLYLADEKGKKYPLSFDCKNCEMVVEHPI